MKQAPDSMNILSNDERWAQIQSQLINRIWFGFILYALIGVPASVFRATYTGWLPIYGVHIFIAVLILAVTIMGKSVSSHIKTTIIFAVLFGLGLGGIYQFGLVGQPAMALAIGYIMLAILMPLKRAVQVGVVVTSFLGLIAYGYSSGALHSVLDLNKYAENSVAWVNLFVSVVCSTLVLAYAIAVYQNSIKSLLGEVKAQHDEIAKQKDIIEHQATHDMLTGLPTLRLACDRLDMACKQAYRDKSKAAVLFIDLDGFKMANDTFGHEAGDHVLKVVANCLKELIRSIDTAARHGGDEFIVIIHDAQSIDDATTLADKLVKAIAEPIYYNDQLVKISCCIGVAVYPDHASSAEEILRCADEAMYVVKRSGKNNFSVYAGATPRLA